MTTGRINQVCTSPLMSRTMENASDPTWIHALAASINRFRQEVWSDDSQDHHCLKSELTSQRQRVKEPGDAVKQTTVTKTAGRCTRKAHALHLKLYSQRVWMPTKTPCGLRRNGANLRPVDPITHHNTIRAWWAEDATCCQQFWTPAAQRNTAVNQDRPLLLDSQVGQVSAAAAVSSRTLLTTVHFDFWIHQTFFKNKMLMDFLCAKKGLIYTFYENLNTFWRYRRIH